MIIAGTQASNEMTCPDVEIVAAIHHLVILNRILLFVDLGPGGAKGKLLTAFNEELQVVF
ncbi:MAG: hypothetical protein TREMPRED_005237, partial [Tremellales sp. Tagirdzhanova-0007]